MRKTDSPPEPVRLGLRQTEAASRVLARAFRDDQMMRYLIPDDARRQRVLPRFLGGVVRYCLAHGEVHTTPGLDGVACWLSPGNTKTTFPRIVTSGMILAPLQLGPAGFRRLVDLTSYMDALHERLMPEPHRYLWLLGVEPSSKGQGIGGRLLRPVLERADAVGQPCYLETQNADNLKFYEKHGFELADAGKLPGRELQVWAMIRQPRELHEEPESEG